MSSLAAFFIEQSMGFYFGLLFFSTLFTKILKKRDHFALRFWGGSLVGFLIVFLVPEYRAISVAPSTKTLAIYLVFILLMLFCYRGSFKTLLFVDISSLTSQHLSLCITEVFTIAFGISDGTLYAASSVVGALFTWLVVYLLFTRELKDGNKVESMDYTLILVAVFLFLIIFLAQRVVITYETITASFRFFDGLTCCLGLFILFIQLGKTSEEWENRMLKELMEAERKRYHMLEESMDAINRKAHDLKYAERAWKAGMLTEQDMQDEYVEEYDYIARTGYAPLDNLLTEKGLFCNKNDIQFTYMVDGDQFRFMGLADLVILFGNAIDNAIECVMRYEDPEKRIISLVAAKREGSVRIHIENYCEDELSYKGDLPASHKKDRDNHGFGLKSIRYLVDKYGGMMGISCEERMFTLSISIPV